MTTETKPDAAQLPTEILTGLPGSPRIARALRRGARRLVVLTPDPEHARDLAHRFRHAKQVEIVTAALAGTGGTAEWVRYNEAGLGAFRAPTARLRALFPGLDIRKRLTVQRMSCAELGAHLGPDAGPLVLEMDAPGEEAEIVEALAASGLLTDLREIRLRAGRQVLFEGGVGLAKLFPALRRCGYQLIARDDSDPDRPLLSFAPDLMQRDLRQELAALGAQSDEVDKLNRELAGALQMQRLLRADLDDLQARYQAAETARAAQAGLLHRLLASLEDAVGQMGARPDGGEAASTPQDEIASGDQPVARPGTRS